jgi:hypothetical protein
MVCGLDALKAGPFERLPNDALAMQAVHENQVRHTWLEYRSMSHLTNEDEKPKEVQHMNCLKCRQPRIVATRTPDPQRPEIVSYFFNYGHDERCYITDPEQRKTLLQTLGRYIDGAGPIEEKVDAKGATQKAGVSASLKL